MTHRCHIAATLVTQDDTIFSLLHLPMQCEFMEDVRIATGKEVDVFDVAHIQPDSQIANEIRASGVSLYEK